MAPTIRDWQLHGVDLKVELATSGSLVVGGNQTDYPFESGGEYGAPLGYDAGRYFQGNNGFEQDFNWTTQTGIFSVSTKAANPYGAGIWLINPFPLVPGYRYQFGCQVRQMAGKDATWRNCSIQSSTDKVSWTYLTGAASPPNASTDWEQILATSAPVGTNVAWGRLQLLGTPPSGATNLWGIQYQNVFVRQLDKTPDPIVWTDITCDVKNIAIRYGRERFTNRYDVATMQLDLVNMSGIYSFHQPHPLGLQPGRQVRVTATYKGVTYPMAFHVLDSMVDAYDMEGTVISRWSCVDPTSVLSNVNVKTNQSQYPHGAGERIGLLLDQVGWVPRLMDPDIWSMQYITASGRTIRDEAGVTADSEGGQFFADREGNCVYKNRDWLKTDAHVNQVTADVVAYPAGDAVPVVDQVPTQSGAPIIAARELVTDWSLARLINFVSLAVAGGNAQEFIDQDSYEQYGPATYQRHDFVLYDGYHLPERAADIMTGYTEPVLRVNTVAFAPGQSVKPDKVSAQVDGYFNGSSWLQTPDTPNLTPVPPVEFRWKMRATDWEVSYKTIFYQSTTNQASFTFYMQNGQIAMSATTDGVTARYSTFLSAAELTPLLPLDDKDVIIVARIRPLNTYFETQGAISVDDGATWFTAPWRSTVAQLTSFWNSNQPLNIAQGFAGRIYWAEMVNGIAPAAQTVVWRFDANEYPGTGTSYVDPRGRTWTMGSTGTIIPKVPGTNIPGPPAWEWTLGVFLNWLIRVWYTHPLNFWGYAVCLHIQSIEHRITPTDWETSMAVDLPVSFVELEWLDIQGWDQQDWDEELWDQGDEPAGSLWDTGANWDNPNSVWGA